jgi:phosphatidylinositol alpha-mannosyltransferase
MYHFSLPQPGRKPGGVEVFVDRLATALQHRGHDMEVLTYSPAPPSAPYRVRRMRPHSTVHRRLLRQYGAPWLLNLQSLSQFDVAHFHGDDWFLFRRPLPVVRTFHGSALLESLSAASRLRRIDKALVFPLELLAGSMATSTYGVGVDSEIIYRTDGLLPLGVDMVEGVTERSSNPSIMFIGTWDGRKRGAFLHDVFTREIRPAIPEAELWMVSDRCEPAEGVRWIKAPSDAELSSWLSRSWCFCLPSTYEGFGIPYLEAMAHGIPVVASANPGAKSLLEEGRSGILTEDSELGARLIEVLNGPELRAALAVQGRRRAAEYSWERMVERHEDAYEGAIERWRSGRGQHDGSLG